ncbi:MAG: DUF503 domain-containing protein [candidate division WOR-3 bacterium]|nr:DUF503 domain-containing protein [candidate division WOR-3 bacterium]MCX7757556.1 DUF503 domain-containing protein [candidate division WOR-3 bacterium]MDW7987110.1 DUF503 domain-containing protein [candidate division WOR-3 bacterium]
MSVGLLVVDCHIENGFSLKDKRKVLLGLTKKIRENFNVAIAETKYQDLWQRTELSIVLVNTNYKEIERNYEKIIEFIQKDPRIRVLNYETTALY